MKMSQRGYFHLIPLISSSSARFCATECPQPLFHQSLPHSSQAMEGGGYLLPIRSTLVACHRKSCVCHTSEKSPAKLYIYHTSKNGIQQVPCLPHLRY